jgi:hypothetical protein
MRHAGARGRPKEAAVTDLAGGIFIFVYVATILWLALRAAAAVGLLAAAALFFLLWFAALLAIGTGMHGAGMPANLWMFGFSLLVPFVGWAILKPLRRVVDNIPLPSLVALHAWRLGGFFFLLLYVQERVPAPFGPVAAVGDMIAGAWAAIMAARMFAGRGAGRGLLGAWNWFGLLDLVAALTLALLAAPAIPFRIFEAPTAGLALLDLPWVAVPAFIVPVLIFTHAVIFRRLDSLETAASAGPVRS